MNRSSCPDVFCEKSALKNISIFTGKHLCWSLFSIKLEVFNFIKKALQHRFFLVKVLRTPNLKTISKQLLLNEKTSQIKCFCIREDSSKICNGLLQFFLFPFYSLFNFDIYNLMSFKFTIVICILH